MIDLHRRPELVTALFGLWDEEPEVHQTGPREWTVAVRHGEYVVRGTFGFDEAGRLIRDDLETVG